MRPQTALTSAVCNKYEWGFAFGSFNNIFMKKKCYVAFKFAMSLPSIIIYIYWQVLRNCLILTEIFRQMISSYLMSFNVLHLIVPNLVSAKEEKKCLKILEEEVVAQNSKANNLMKLKTLI